MIDNKKYFNILFKSFLWFFTLFIIFIVGFSNVFADTTNIGYVSDYTQVLVGIPNYGAPITLNQNISVNNSTVNALWFNVNYNFLKDETYQFEISTPNAKLININTFGIEYNGGVCNFLGYSDADIGFPKIYFKCLQNVSYLSISLKNWDDNTIVNASNFTWSYTYLRTVTDDEIDFGPVISNQTNNTNNIINNQNQNTQNIINNQNQNTQAQIESQKVCKVIDKSYIEKNDYLLNSSGGEVSGTNFGITSYIPISNTSTLFPIEVINNGAGLCFYKDDKTVISCVLNNTLTVNNNLTIPNNAVYFRATINYSFNKPIFKLCTNGNQALDDSINNLNDNLNNDDSSGATSEASDFFQDFTTNTFGLTSIITAPLNLIQSLTTSTCSSLHLPLPYLNNKYLDLPCMSSIYSQYFGTFFTMYQTITYGIIAYWVIVRIFNQVKDFKNPEHDEIEVVDL